MRDFYSGKVGPISSETRFRRSITAAAFLTLLTLVVSKSALGQTDLPDPIQTPGLTNPDVTPDNIKKTICVTGYTSTIRPPAYYTTSLKKRQLKQAKYMDKQPADYEEDHLISLELGGHPRDPKNLWPQSYSGTWNARVKDQLENTLKKLVCSGQLDLREAQTMISSDWITAYRDKVGQ